MAKIENENLMGEIAKILDEGYETNEAKIAVLLIGVTGVLVEVRNFLDGIESYVISIDGKLDKLIK